MKGIAVGLVVIGILTTIIVSIFQLEPVPFFIDYFGDSTGRYPVAQVYGCTALVFMTPGAILIMIDNALEKFKKKK